MKVLYSGFSLSAHTATDNKTMEGMGSLGDIPLNRMQCVHISAKKEDGSYLTGNVRDLMYFMHVRPATKFRFPNPLHLNVRRLSVFIVFIPLYQCLKVPRLHSFRQNRVLQMNPIVREDHTRFP